MDRVFLDANVLFSAAWRADSGLRRLWSLDGTQLLSSAYAVEEARTNLAGADQRSRLDELLRKVEVISTLPSRGLPEGVALPEKDRPILLAAIEAGASHLLTGDLRHFGKLFGRKVEGMSILLPGEFLRTHPSGT